MVIRSHWKPKFASQFVSNKDGREFEVATFEGGKGRIDPVSPENPLQAGQFGTEVRASVFLKGGSVQFTVDTVAQLPQLDAAFQKVREEARRRIIEGEWEPGEAYYL